MKAKRYWFLVIAVLEGLACSRGGAAGSPDGAGGALGDAGQTSGGGLPFGDGSAGDAQGGCSESAKLIYVVSSDFGSPATPILRSFDPVTLTFDEIGAMSCPGIGEGQMRGLAIARDGVAYVGSVAAAQLWKVSTVDASCEATPFQDPQGGGIYGLAFSSDTSGGATETLYSSISKVSSDLTSDGLAKIALPSYQSMLIGDYSHGLEGELGSLTGTGDGRLFGLLWGRVEGNSQAWFTEIDKTNAATPAPIDVSSVFLDGDIVLSGAFAFWGGDIWFFTLPEKSSDGGAGIGSSRVTRYKYSTDRSFVVEIADIGFAVTGAAVSTCAPLTTPR